MTDYTGKIVFLDESAPSGGWWAFIADNNYNSYPENTYILQNGDALTILAAQSPTVVWTGTINLRPVKLVSETVNGYWIRDEQVGLPISTWAGYFISQLPAKLTTNNLVINPDYSVPS